MSGQDCISDSILHGKIWRDQIISNCGGIMPKATLYRRLSPQRGDRDLCKIMVRTRVQIETEVEGSDGTAKREHDNITQKKEAYLIRSRALDFAFARRSNIPISFELFKTCDKYATYHLVRVRSSKALGNCTVSVMPISGIIKNESRGEYHTSWCMTAGATIDLNPDEPVESYLVAVLTNESVLAHMRYLEGQFAIAESPEMQDRLQSSIRQLARSMCDTGPPCYIIGPTGKMSTAQKEFGTVPVPISYELRDFPYVLVFTVYSSKGFAWVPILLEGKPRNNITPHIISEYKSRGGPHWSYDITKKRTKKVDGDK